jgi:hypothetical protein
LKGYEPYIDEMIDKLIRILDQHEVKGQPINMTKWSQFCKRSFHETDYARVNSITGAFDVMSKISFGEPLGFLEKGYDFNGMLQAQREQFRYISVANNFPLLDSWTKRNPFLKFVKKKPPVFFAFARRIVRERLAKAEKTTDDETERHEDMLGSFIAARKTYPLMDETRLTHISATNVLAGANNSARASKSKMSNHY